MATNKTVLEQMYEFQTKLQGVANDLAIQLSSLALGTDLEVTKLIVKGAKKQPQRDIRKALEAMQKLIAKIRVVRDKTYKAAEDLILTTSADVALAATNETSKEFQRALANAAKEEREKRFCKTLTQEQLDAIIDGQGISGGTIRDWFHRWTQTDMETITRAVQQASVEEMSVSAITKLIRGTADKNYTDGILHTTRVSAVRMARTIINGVSNNARVETIKANQDVIDGVKFIGTLDGKTCPYCGSLDGYIWSGDEMGQARRPPIHPNCRCTLIPYVELKDADGNPIDLEGERPAANADFDALAKEAYNARARKEGWNRRWDDLSQSTRLKYYYQAQKDFESRTGTPAYSQVPASLTFADYFQKQPVDFKRSWLGGKRFELYEEGRLTEKNLFAPDLSYRATASALFDVAKKEETSATLMEIVLPETNNMMNGSYFHYSSEMSDNVNSRSARFAFQQKKEETKHANPLFNKLEELANKPIKDIFIDDVFEYAERQRGKSLLESLSEIYTGVEDEQVSKLSSNGKGVFEKRYEEIRQLVDRGRRMIKAGYTVEYTDRILRLTYEMSKDGLREALSFDIRDIVSLFPKKAKKLWYNTVDEENLVQKLGWFNSDNGEIRILNGRVFHSVTEYIASKMSAESFNIIEEANSWQGGFSYCIPSCGKKYAVLKSMGYDITRYENWEEASRLLSRAGFYVQKENGNNSKMCRAFDFFKNNLDLFGNYYEGQIVFDAAIQLLLENAEIPGVDKKDSSMILVRTENGNILPKIKKGNLNGNEYCPGVCESHGHIVPCMVNGNYLTVVRVPFSRIHSLWFLEKGSIKEQNYYKLDNFQFDMYFQNEIDACTHKLPIIAVGDISFLNKTYQKALDVLTSWERKNLTNE